MLGQASAGAGQLHQLAVREVLQLVSEQGEGMLQWCGCGRCGCGPPAGQAEHQRQQGRRQHGDGLGNQQQGQEGQLDRVRHLLAAFSLL